MRSASFVTNRVQNQTLFEHQRQNGRRDPLTQDARIDTFVGGMPLYENGVLVSNPLPPPPPPFQPWDLYSAFFYALDALFAYNASIGMGPTVSARNYYLFLASLTHAYNWIYKQPLVSGVKDGIDWSIQHTLTTDADQLCWMNHVIITLMPYFIPTFNTQLLWEKERAALQWNEETQQLELNRIKEVAKWDTWFSAWQTWFSSRATDGSKEAAAVPTDLPNGSIFLEVTTTQDIASYPHPDKWTPLSLSGKQRRYLTAGWGNVRSTCLSASDESTIKTNAGAEFSTPEERTDEIESLLTLTQALTDTQKLIAELWAGGPGTVSPPGMYMMLWKQFCTAKPMLFSTLLLSGLQLSITLFEGSRLTWALKRQYMEARPIQEIRNRYKNDDVLLYDGTTVKGERWVPFQATNFVTPPFPDFPSGHSCFGKCFANVMTNWFGASLPSVQITMSNAKLFSPTLTSTLTTTFGTFPIAQGASEVQPSVEPSTPLTLTFTTWNEMAESSGVSRQYGGIHCASAHSGSLIVANEVCDKVKQKWF